jgi:hypothetical protein
MSGILGDLTNDTPGSFDGKEFGIVRKRSEKHRISLPDVGVSDCLEPAPGTGYYTDCIHIQPCSNFLMEPGNRRFADVIETVGFAAVIADRITIPISDDGFHRICSEPATCLNRINIYEELIDLPRFYSGSAPHFSISCFKDATCRSRFSSRRCAWVLWVSSIV